MIEKFKRAINTGSVNLKARLQTKRQRPSPVRRNTAATPSAKRALLAAARQLFARKGLSDTSIRDIAKAARLNSSLISYYFAGKSGLYRACLEEIAGDSLQMTERVLKPADSPAEFRLRLQLFLDEIFALFLEDRDTGLILIREYDRAQSPAQDVFRASFLRMFGLIVAYFEHGQRIGAVDPGKDPVTLAGLLFGCVTSQMRMDHLFEKSHRRSLLDAREKRKIEDHIVDLFTIPPKNEG